MQLQGPLLTSVDIHTHTHMAFTHTNIYTQIKIKKKINLNTKKIKTTKYYDLFFLLLLMCFM